MYALIHSCLNYYSILIIFKQESANQPSLASSVRGENIPVFLLCFSSLAFKHRNDFKDGLISPQFIFPNIISPSFASYQI